MYQLRNVGATWAEGMKQKPAAEDDGASLSRRGGKVGRPSGFQEESDVGKSGKGSGEYNHPQRPCGAKGQNRCEEIKHVSTHPGKIIVGDLLCAQDSARGVRTLLERRLGVTFFLFMEYELPQFLLRHTASRNSSLPLPQGGILRVNRR